MQQKTLGRNVDLPSKNLSRGGLTPFLVRAGAILPRICLGVIFLWFGSLKLVAGMSPAEDLASRTLVALTAHLFAAEPLVRILGGVECAIGLCFLFGFFLRTTLIVFFIHMFGTFTALIFCPGECFSAGPLGLTLIGQYIIKNLVLVSAGLTLIPNVAAARQSPPQAPDAPRE